MDIRCLNDAHGDSFAAYHGDCVDVLRQMPDGCVDFSVYSPPFAGLYIYNNSAADMGNCCDDAEFFKQYGFLVRELYRVMRPGRIIAVHCKDLVYYQNQRGTSGLRDFPGELIRSHIASGFDFHSRVTVWRCPKREMNKSNPQGLLYVQLRSDGSYSRHGLPEYIVVFRKWAKDGDQVAAVKHYRSQAEERLKAYGPEDVIVPADHPQCMPLAQWQDFASPVWMDTRETDVLNARRDPTDEKHICPLPLDLIRRCVMLWSNPGDTVLSPFMGIGSEGYVSMKLRRKFIGVELKDTYFNQAVGHLRSVDSQPEMFHALA